MKGRKPTHAVSKDMLIRLAGYSKLAKGERLSDSVLALWWTGKVSGVWSDQITSSDPTLCMESFLTNFTLSEMTLRENWKLATENITNIKYSQNSFRIKAGM